MKFHSGQFLTTLVLCLGAVGLSAAGCELIASVDRQKIDQGGSGGSGMGGEGGTATGGGMGGGMGGSGGMAGAGGGTGGTGGVQCMQPADCPPPANECVMATCLNNTCGTMNVPQGMQTPTQVKGDCMLNQCTGTGEVESIDDDTDATDDMNACTTDTCQQDGTTMHTNLNAGSPCTENGGTVCNNMGACVECVPGIAECMVPDICQNGMCNLPTCANAMKDGTETDSDCGGPDCSPCATNKNCMVPSDCISTVCTSGKCQAATCTDTVKNGTETDVDCGGASCPGCAEGQVCLANSDCASGSCFAGFCGPSGAGGAGGAGGVGGVGGVGAGGAGGN